MKMNHRRYKVVYVSTAEESFKQKYLLPVFALCSVLLGMLVRPVAGSSSRLDW